MRLILILALPAVFAVVIRAAIEMQRTVQQRYVARQQIGLVVRGHQRELVVPMAGEQTL